MGNLCVGPAPQENADVSGNVVPVTDPQPAATSTVPPTTTHTQHSAVAGLEIDQVKPAMVPIHRQQSIKRQVTITLKPVDLLENEDIEIIRKGENYLIKETNALIDIATCQIIGYLNAEGKAILESNDYVKEMCEKYGMDFQSKGCF